MKNTKLSIWADDANRALGFELRGFDPTLDKSVSEKDLGA